MVDGGEGELVLPSGERIATTAEIAEHIAAVKEQKRSELIAQGYDEQLVDVGLSWAARQLIGDIKSKWPDRLGELFIEGYPRQLEKLDGWLKVMGES